MSLNTVPLSKSERDLELYRRLFANNGFPHPVEHMRWLCSDRDLPLHGALSLDEACSDPDGLPKAAAIYTTLAARFKLGEETALALQSMDTMTDEVYDTAAAEGVPMVYGFPNASSRNGFFQKLGWECLNPVPFLIRPLRTGYFARRLLKADRLKALAPDLPLPRRPRWTTWPGVRIEEVAEFPTDTDALWSKFSTSFKAGLVRDLDYLEWRYRRKPGVSYRIHAARKAGVLQGLTVSVDLDKHDGHIGYLMELLFVPGASGVADALIAHTLADLARRRCDAVLAWWFAHSPGHAAYRANGFVRLPEKLRPIELNFGCRAFAPRFAALLGERRNWHLSYSDSDTV